MTCSGCKKDFAARNSHCPHCGQANASTGIFQTSTVLIASNEAEGVFRSVEEVPAPLRSKLFESTNGDNSATILIADRRGREEIARALRSTPGPIERGFLPALLGARPLPKRRFRVSTVRLAVAAFLVVAALAAMAWLIQTHLRGGFPN